MPENSPPTKRGPKPASVTRTYRDRLAAIAEGSVVVGSKGTRSMAKVTAIGYLAVIESNEEIAKNKED